MKVTCTKCNTTFEIKNSQLQDNLSGVSCPRCHHVYSPVPDTSATQSAPDLPAGQKGSASARIPAGPSVRFSFKAYLIVSALVLLILSLGFNAMLSLTSLEKLYVESTVSQYRVMGKDLQRNIQKSIRFGKKIEKFVGMDSILLKTRQNIIGKINVAIMPDTKTDTNLSRQSESDISVSVALPDGFIQYSTDKKLTGTSLPKQIRGSYDESTDEKSDLENAYIKYNGTYNIMLPVHDSNKKWAATVILRFDENQIKALFSNVMAQNLIIISIILVCGFIVLIILLGRVTRLKPGDNKFPKLKISLVIFIVIGLAQIAFSGLNIHAFKNYYLRINTEKSHMLTALLKDDLEYLFSKGIKISKLSKLDVSLKEILSAAPELKDITVYDEEKNPLYIATQGGMVDLQESAPGIQSYENPVTGPDQKYHFQLNLIKDGKVHGYISTNISKEALFDQLLEITMDSVTVLVISILFFLELMILFLPFIEKHMAGIEHHLTIHYSAIRPAAFLFLFGIDISISFIPLYMEKLYEPMFGLSKEMVLGLPISVEMFFAGIALFISGAWLDRRGWHEPFLTGLFLGGIGILYSWQAPNAIHFIISRGIAGLGYGLALMASQGFVITFTDPKSKAQGLSHVVAGIFAGSICGGATGGMLAERIGYSPVFFIGAFIEFFVIVYILVFMKEAIKAARPKPKPSVDKPLKQPIKINDFFRFIFNREVLGLIFLSSFPAAIAVVGFLNYFCPIYLNRIGSSQSSIGRIFMIYGICLIYVAPFISRYVDQSDNKKIYIAISGFLGSMAFLSFYFFEGIAVAALAVLLLGLSSSFGFASQNAYALQLDVTKRLGAGKAMGIIRLANRIGQVLGPVLFGSIIVATKIKNGIAYVGWTYLAISLIFLVSVLKDRGKTLLTHSSKS
ncbi:MAG: MFS transporter [Desulfobacterales bacterium]|nr:MFS transporter [Desulfobacterales bacterium]MDD4072169.1 MFS transporter [Desulfobacterales bacterium]MDD4393776.1 MFS transporter [Desulfobacterales bacterium]